VAGNYASTPDANALDITGDIDIRVRVAMDDWTPAALSETLIAKEASGTQRSFRFVLIQSGSIGLVLSSDGSAIASAFSSIATGLVDGTTQWVRVTWRASDGRVQFFLGGGAATPSWVQLGTDQAIVIASIFSSSSILEIGTRLNGGTEPAAGKFYRAIVRDGINGTTVFDADFTQGITSGAQTTFTATTGQTVTINRSTAGRKSVAVVRPVWLLGTDDFFEVADNALLDFDAGDSFTVIAVVRQWNASNGRLVSKGSLTTDSSWGISSEPLIAVRGSTGSTAILSGPSRTLGAVEMIAGVRNATADELRAHTNSSFTSATDPTTGTLANASSMQIGRQPTGIYADMELLAVAVFRRALTASEIATIAAYYGAI
jgi:hypothetical protein